MRNISKIGLLLSFSFIILSHSKLEAKKKPKIVVGIIVDQMRQEYLHRFYGKFGKNGFKRLMNEGYMLENMRFNYVPTATAPGHASVYTGTTPAYHGIVHNDWYDRKTKSKVYCVRDNNVFTVGSTNKSGLASPKHLMTTTITDELKLATQFKSKVISVSIKDRSAVLPAGHHPDGAYWYDEKTGNFVTSSYYMDKLPTWVKKFNDQKVSDYYVEQTWKTKYPESSYTESYKNDLNRIQGILGRSEFPYDLMKLSKGVKNYENILFTPFGNDMLSDFVQHAIQNAGFGESESTDFLAISYSSTDFVGHIFGPQSMEIEDTYIRLDENIESLLKTLDKKFGKNNYLFYLTADHGMVESPYFLQKHGFPGAYYSTVKIEDYLNEKLQELYGEGDWVVYVDDVQVYLNRSLIKKKNLKLHDIQIKTAYLLEENKVIIRAIPAYALDYSNFGYNSYKDFMNRGYLPSRSGDVMYALKSGWNVPWGGEEKGAVSHGTSYAGDTHVPMLFFGQGIKNGHSSKLHKTADLAATISMLLKIKFPSGCVDGEPIQDILGY